MNTFEQFGLVGSDLEEMEAFSATRKAERTERALIEFGAIDSNSSAGGEFHEVDLPGEICPEYAEVMAEFSELIYQESMVSVA